MKAVRDLLPAWTALAACAQGKLDARFFSEETSAGGYSDDILSAKALCLTCPVRKFCLEYAYELEKGTYREGVFGGSTGEQRQAYSLVPDRVDTLLEYLEIEARELQIAPVKMRLVAQSPKRKVLAHVG